MESNVEGTLPEWISGSTVSKEHTLVALTGIEALIAKLFLKSKGSECSGALSPALQSVTNSTCSLRL